MSLKNKYQDILFAILEGGKKIGKSFLLQQLLAEKSLQANV